MTAKAVTVNLFLPSTSNVLELGEKQGYAMLERYSRLRYITVGAGSNSPKIVNSTSTGLYGLVENEK
jgi:hypothetical protein